MAVNPNSCSDAPSLGIKIDNLSDKHDSLARLLDASIQRIEKLLEQFTTRFDASVSELVKVSQRQETRLAVLENEGANVDKELGNLSDTLSKQTADQETRLVMVENKMEEVRQKVVTMQDQVSKHSTRLAQAGVLVLLVSLAGPVFLEHLLQSPPQSEIRPR